MAQVKVKEHSRTETSLVPKVFHSYFVVDPKCSPRDMGDMVGTQVNIEDDRDIVDAIFDE